MITCTHYLSVSDCKQYKCIASDYLNEFLAIKCCANHINRCKVSIVLRLVFSGYKQRCAHLFAFSIDDVYTAIRWIQHFAIAQYIYNVRYLIWGVESIIR